MNLQAGKIKIRAAIESSKANRVTLKTSQFSMAPNASNECQLHNEAYKWGLAFKRAVTEQLILVDLSAAALLNASTSGIDEHLEFSKLACCLHPYVKGPFGAHEGIFAEGAYHTLLGLRQIGFSRAASCRVLAAPDCSSYELQQAGITVGSMLHT